MGVFKKFKLNETTMSKGGVYFNAGFNYLLKIERMHIVETREKGDMFVVDFRITESNDPARKVGTMCNFAQLLSNDMAGINIKELLVAASGIDKNNDAEVSDNDWDQIAEACVGDDQPFKDESVNLETYTKEKKKTRIIKDLAQDKREYVTVHNWAPA